MCVIESPVSFILSLLITFSGITLLIPVYSTYSPLFDAPLNSLRDQSKRVWFQLFCALGHMPPLSAEQLASPSMARRQAYESTCATPGSNCTRTGDGTASCPYALWPGSSGVGGKAVAGAGTHHKLEKFWNMRHLIFRAAITQKGRDISIKFPVSGCIWERYIFSRLKIQDE